MTEPHYRDTFIAVADDCPVEAGVEPPAGKVGVAQVQLAMLLAAPYAHTQPDLLFAASAGVRDGEVPDSELPARRDAFFAKPQACLRSSPLGKRWSWGLHLDADGRVAAYGRESPEYARLATDPALTPTRPVASRRKR